MQCLAVFLMPTLGLHVYSQDLRRKAARLVAAKCTLAARVDGFHESSDGKVTRVTGNTN